MTHQKELTEEKKELFAKIDARFPRAYRDEIFTFCDQEIRTAVEARDREIEKNIKKSDISMWDPVDQQYVLEIIKKQ